MRKGLEGLKEARSICIAFQSELLVIPLSALDSLYIDRDALDKLPEPTQIDAIACHCGLCQCRSEQP